MISVICVFNDDVLLEINLLNSLKRQDVNYQLILVDNRNNEFKTLTQALNYGGQKAKGEYLLFVHQDVQLHGKSWLKRAEKELGFLNDVGIGGVAGIDGNNEPVGFVIDRGIYWGKPIQEPLPALTIDELLFIIPKKVFDICKFDEELKWHSYAADYCLNILSKGLKTYILPLYVSHNSFTLPILKVGSLKDDDLVLWKKYKNDFSAIYKTTDKIEPYIRNPLNKLKQINLFITKKISNLKRYQSQRLFLKQKKILDIIVPIEQPLYLKDHKESIQSVGVSEKFEHLITSKRLNVHKNYILTSLEHLPFRNKVFNVVILKSLLEYLPKHRAKILLDGIESAVKKILIYLPNKGYPRSKAYKLYGSIWNISELKKDGYSIYGIKPKGFFKKKLLTLIEPFIEILCWWIPCLSSFIIAIRDK